MKITNQEKQDLIAALDKAGYEVVSMNETQAGFIMPGSTTPAPQITVTVTPKQAQV